VDDIEYSDCIEKVKNTKKSGQHRGEKTTQDKVENTEEGGQNKG
jgi:hypothetical protein